jgi:hypothetical protein
VPPFDIRLAVNERLVRLSGAREKRGPPLYTLAVRERMIFEVELVSAVLRTLPCVQVAILLRSGQEGIHEKAERSGGQLAFVRKAGMRGGAI